MVNIILILGNYDESVMRKRADRAYDEFLKIKQDDQNNTFILLSGAGRQQKKECDYMNEYLLNKVNSKFLFCENKSMSTYENIIYSFKILKDLFDTNINVYICTSTFHIKRTILLAKLFNSYNFNLKFIHTNEQINTEENNKELYNLDRFMNFYIKSLL